MAIEPRFHKVEKEGPIVIWKFSNPPKNFATLETGAELVQLVEEFDKDPDLRVGIVTSATPGMFIQHFDVSSILGWVESIGAGSDEGMGSGSGEGFSQFLASLPAPKGIADYTSKPIICAINGPVEGGGCDMAMSCDFRFISRDAFMGQPEVLGGFPGGTTRLAKLLGVSRALELCMTGRRIPADEAERLGLVLKACEPEELMPTVIAFAQTLAARPPMGISSVKKAIYGAVDVTLEDGLILERNLFFEAIRSEEALRLMRAYVSAGQDSDRLESIQGRE